MLSCIPIPSSRALLHITVSIPLACFLGVVASRPINTQNITIEVPYGTTNHGELNSFCTPTTWIDIAKFLLFNYVAHGATVVPYPGEPPSDMLLRGVEAILFPTFGVSRALNFIIRRPLLAFKFKWWPLRAMNDLEVAARSGALCMLIRSSNWKPQMGDNIMNALIKDPSDEPSLRGSNTSCSDLSTNKSPTTAALSIYTPPWLNDRSRFWSYTDTKPVKIGSRAVFGLSQPPGQYEFAFVPRNTKVLELVDATPTSSSNAPSRDILQRLFRSLFRSSASSVSTKVSTSRLSPSSNRVKGMVALLQLLYASFTLYHANGGQVNRYGFVAPGLTVIPFAFMSALNLIASLVAPHYPTLYLVRSKVMEEAERRTGSPFHFVVGKVDDESNTDNDVMEGWSEIAGSFKDDDKVLYVTPSVEEDKKIEIHNSSSQRIYAPACPRFRRIDDTQTSPLRRFDEYYDQVYRLFFPRYMAQRQQGIRPSLFSFSRLSSQLLSRVRAFKPRTDRYTPLPQSKPPRSGICSFVTEHLYELILVTSIIGVEIFFTLALSKFSGQQSTLAQKVWIVTWSFDDYFGGLVLGYLTLTTNSFRCCKIPKGLLQFLGYLWMAASGAPALGGFIVVSQMLKEYGICYRFV